MRSILGKRVLITGAGHGLGRELARAFAAAGGKVVVTDRDPERVTATLDVLRTAGYEACGYPFDVTDAASIQAVRERLHAEHGPIDVLINNAGIVAGGPFLEVADARHRQTFEVNVLGLLQVTHAFLGDLIAQREAHLVNIASAAALIPLPWGASYAASKAAVLSFSDSLREELRELGHGHVHLTVVCPTYIATGMFAGVTPPRLTPLLAPERVARLTLQAVQRNRQRVLTPWLAKIAPWCGVLPQPMVRVLTRWLRVTTGMADWRGHEPAGDADQ